MAERPNAKLLKSFGMQVPVGSNPTPSAPEAEDETCGDTPGARRGEPPGPNPRRPGRPRGSRAGSDRRSARPVTSDGPTMTKWSRTNPLSAPTWAASMLAPWSANHRQMAHSRPTWSGAVMVTTQRPMSEGDECTVARPIGVKSQGAHRPCPAPSQPESGPPLGRQLRVGDGQSVQRQTRGGPAHGRRGGHRETLGGQYRGGVGQQTGAVMGHHGEPDPAVVEGVGGRPHLLGADRRAAQHQVAGQLLRRSTHQPQRRGPLQGLVDHRLRHGGGNQQAFDLADTGHRRPR